MSTNAGPRRRGARATWARPLWLLAVAGLVAGCGTTVSPSGIGTAVVVKGQPAQAASAQANRQRAEHEAARLLGLAEVPPGSVRVTSTPAHLTGPLARPIVTTQADRTVFWRVPMGFDATLAWLRAHAPAGLTRNGRTGRAGGPGFRIGGDSYGEPNRSGLTGLQLQFMVATADAGHTALRVDALAIWRDPAPLRDTVAGRRLRVDTAHGCPASDLRRVGVTNTGADLAHELLPAAKPTGALVCRYSGLNAHPTFGLRTHLRLGSARAADLASLIRRIDLSHEGGVVNLGCPMDDASVAVLAFSYPGRPDVDLWLNTTGCATVSNGDIVAGALGLDSHVPGGRTR